MQSVPGDSTAQEAAARANPAPFDPVVVGSSAGLLLLAFGISTGRADPQLKMASKKSPGGRCLHASRQCGILSLAEHHDGDH